MFSCSGHVRLSEGLKQLGCMLSRHANASVLNRELELNPSACVFRKLDL
jgi:hypothetical protein